MSTQSTTLKRPPKKQPKKEHPSLIKAKQALEPKNANPNTLFMNIQPESSENTLKVNPVYKNGYKVKEIILDLKQWRKIPVSEEWLNGLAYEIVKWAEKEDTFVWEDFYREYGMLENTLFYLEGRYELIKEAKDHARKIIAARRDRMAFTMKASGSVMLGTQAYHSSSFRDYSKEKAQWTQPEQTTGDKMVVQYVYPDDYAELQKKVALYEARSKKPDTSEEVPSEVVPD